jgi:anti-sigma factor RsiW
MRDDRKNVVDMGGSRVDDDHLLSMYIDNELDAEQTIAFVSRLKSEPALRTRLTQLEENDGLIKQVYAQSAASIPNHVAALISADNVTLLRPVRQWRRWTTAAVAASCAAVVAMVLNTNQTAVFNPMTIDAQMAHVLESSPSRATGWETLDDERMFRSVLTFPAADGK